MALELKIVSPSEEGFVKEIVWNADEIASEVEAKVGYYKNLVYTEDQVTEAKKDRAQLNKFIAALKDKDREIKALCLAPYEVFHKQMLKIIGKVEEPVALIDKQVKDFEEEQRKKKYIEIKALFDTKGFQTWVTLDRIENPKWLNKSYSMKQIYADLTSIQHKIGEDILLINGLKEGTQAALSEYRRSMDATAAMAAATRYVEAKRAEEELKKTTPLEDSPLFGEGMDVQAAAQAHMLDVVQAPLLPVEPARKEILFKVFVTREEMEKLNRFLIDNGYTFRQVRNNQ